MEDDLVIIPLRNALQSRQPLPRLITHSDRGGQYVSNDLHEPNQFVADQAQHEPGRATVADDPYDNAFAESFWIGPPKRPLESGTFLNVEDARTEIFEYIEMYYNRVRKHSSLGYKSPEQFEQEYYTKLASTVCC